VGVRLYRTNLEWFETWFERHDRDIALAVAALRALMADAEGEEAFTRLEATLPAIDPGPLPAPP
jgi:hypothetical protein